MREALIQAQIIQYLTLQGHFVRRKNAGLMQKDNRWIRFGKKGDSDIVGISKDGKGIAIECKNEIGVATPEQLAFLKEYTDRKGYGFVARSIEDCIQKGL